MHWKGAKAVAFAAALPFLAAAGPPSSKSPVDLQTLRKAFAAAVAAKDIRAVARLSRFPLAVDVYGSKPEVTEREFTHGKKYLEGWFFGGDAALVKCLASQPPALQNGNGFGAGAWVVDCNGNEYYFAQRDGGWAFVAYQNINE